MSELHLEAGFYSIITHDVLYNNDISANEKLLYAVISGLTKSNGYCWASNDYLARKLGTTKRSVARWLSNLEKNGFVHREVFRGDTNQVEQRRIYIITAPRGGRSDTPHVAGDTRGMSQVSSPSGQNRHDPHVTDGADNSQSNSQSNRALSKNKYGDNQNVLMTEDEYKKLSEKFPNDLEKRINNLGYYMASTGKSYKSHYMTIIAWARRDKEKVNSKKKPLDLSDVFDEKDNSNQWARLEERKHANGR